MKLVGVRVGRGGRAVEERRDGGRGGDEDGRSYMMVVDGEDMANQREGERAMGESY